MEDSTLLCIALFTSLAGLGLLWFVAAGFEPEVVALDELSDEYLGRVVTVHGSVGGIKEYDTAMVVSFDESEVVLFGFKHVLGHVAVGDNITITGEVEEYNGVLEIVPGSVEDVVVVTS